MQGKCKGKKNQKDRFKTKLNENRINSCAAVLKPAYLGFKGKRVATLLRGPVWKISIVLRNNGILYFILKYQHLKRIANKDRITRHVQKGVESEGYAFLELGI